MIRIGHLDAGQRGRFVGIKGERTVRLVALERIAEMTPDLFRLRDKSVLKADPAGPGKASVEGAENRFNLVRRDGGWEILPEREERETVGRADPFVVQDMLEGVFGAEIREFVRATPPDQGRPDPAVDLRRPDRVASFLAGARRRRSGLRTVFLSAWALWGPV